MLSKVEVYTSAQTVTVLPLAEPGRAETDLLQVRDIQGLDPVKAAISTTTYGALDGVAITGREVPSRNIVLTVHPNPDWTSWTPETLRQLLYSYFMPKSSVKLVFTSDEIGVVEISGEVESCDANPFSKDPEFIVSIICPDPYFTSVNSLIVSGETIVPDDFASGKVTVHLGGNIPSGIELTVLASDPWFWYTQIGNPQLSFFHLGLSGTGADPQNLDLNSRPKQKFVRKFTSGGGIVTNLLAKILAGSVWPTLQPGNNDFAVMTDVGGEAWMLRYYERYGGL